MRLILSACVIAAAAAAACARSTQVGSPAATTATTACAGTRILVVNNGGDEAVNVYALNGRTSTEIGSVPQGKKELTVPPNVRATSFYAVAISRTAIGGSVMSAPTETRVIFQEECRPK
jgi:hypothetical protein